MKVRIYRPAKTAMQSGQAGTLRWVMEFPPDAPRVADPLMGWTGSTDTQAQVQLTFETKEEAVAFAEKHGARTVRTGHEIKEGEFWEHKMVGPDNVGFDLYDVRGRGWPGISALEDLGVKGEITPESHKSAKGLADA